MSEKFLGAIGVGALALMASTQGLAQEAISASAMQQIEAVMTLKANLTPGQKKLDSALAYGSMAKQDDPRVSGFRAAIPALANEERVDIHGTVTPDLLAAIAAAGGTVQTTSAQFGRIIAVVPVAALEGLAARADVTSIRKPSKAVTNVGKVTSQGYISHGANAAVAAGWTGAGVKIGVLSDSAHAATISALIASGDLPVGTAALPGLEGPADGEDEGTAMMEIIHDIAPGAQLVFATAYDTEVEFANNILALAAAGCKVIVDDVSYFAEGAFQDGVIAKAVNTVVSQGVVYLSSAANSGSLTHGTSGTWQGDYLDGGPVTGPIASAGETGNFHNFGTAGSPQNYNVVLATSGYYFLQWSDPLDGSTNDYDLFLLNSTGTTLKAFSAAVQNGTQDPLEGFYLASAAPGDRVVVVLFSGQQRALRLDTERGRVSIATDGATTGHNAGLNTISMAATYWGAAKDGTKPFVGGATNPTETFSSDGPRKMFYNPDGTPITPGNLLFATNGGTTMQKPDLTAANGGSTLTPGFNPFFGTSASAPHAAAIAALILQARPTYTPAQVKTAMTATALDIMAPGVDRDSGYGLVMALPAVQYALTH